jgi:peptidoglycan-N-acetylglucosamine deacetylase
MYLHKTPFILKQLYPSLTWNKSRSGNKVYLTFDDGPIPEVTEYVLNLLANYEAKATFFCVGDNIRKHPQVFNKIVEQGHAIGNHTFNHLNGFKNNDMQYLENIEQCKQIINTYQKKTTLLFRPPYGRIKKSQIKVLRKDYQIIMWDVLSGDFDPSISFERCLRATIRHTRPGSIVVFHDSIKTYSALKFVLPRYLEYFKGQGFTFAVLE